MTDKLLATIKGNFGFLVAVSSLLMLLGVWYYSTKNLPERVVCLERQAELNKTAISRHETQFDKIDAKLDKIMEKQERLIMRIGSGGRINEP